MAIKNSFADRSNQKKLQDLLDFVPAPTCKYFILSVLLLAVNLWAVYNIYERGRHLVTKNIVTCIRIHVVCSSIAILNLANVAVNF
jgi:hypothetical protein